MSLLYAATRDAYTLLDEKGFSMHDPYLCLFVRIVAHALFLRVTDRHTETGLEGQYSLLLLTSNGTFA